MTWQVTWYEMWSVEGRFGTRLGSSEFKDLNFNFDWGQGAIFNGIRDGIGFQATTRIIPLSNKLTITIGADDASRLFFDDKKVIDNWGYHGGGHKRVTEVIETIPFKPAELKYEWYEWGRYASAEFKADPMQMQMISGVFPFNLPFVAKAVDIIAIPFDVFSLIINPNPGVAADLPNPLDFLKQFLPQKEEEEEEEQEQGKGGGKRTRIVDIEKF